MSSTPTTNSKTPAPASPPESYEEMQAYDIDIDKSGKVSVIKHHKGSENCENPSLPSSSPSNKPVILECHADAQSKTGKYEEVKNPSNNPAIIKWAQDLWTQAPTLITYFQSALKSHVQTHPLNKASGGPDFHELYNVFGTAYTLTKKSEKPAVVQEEYVYNLYVTGSNNNWHIALKDNGHHIVSSAEVYTTASPLDPATRFFINLDYLAALVGGKDKLQEMFDESKSCMEIIRKEEPSRDEKK